MLRIALGRRAFVRSAALAGAGLATGGHLALLPRSALAFAAEGSVPEGGLRGDIHAWVRIEPGGATALLACSGSEPDSYLPMGPAASLPEPAATGSGLLAGEQVSSWERMRAAAAAARALIVETAARGWGVPASACCAEPTCVLHPASGRRRGYTIWVDVVV
jgi:isoquinoline 1-oxidoreductase beta subunit